MACGRHTVVLLYLCCFIVNFFTAGDTKEETCYKDDKRVSCSKKNYNLTRLEASTVGSIKKIVLTDGTVLKLKTLSLKPLAFEVPNFLSEEECDHFRSLAVELGMETSKTVLEDTKDKHFYVLDLNEDKKISVPEMRVTLEESFDIYPNEEDVLQMYDDMDMDTNNDGFITLDELNKVKPGDLERYITVFAAHQPQKRSRFSKQVWLNPDNSTDVIFDQVQKRLSETVRLPRELIKLSNFQVVQYGVDGHYNAHHDSSPVDLPMPCCVRYDRRVCRVCRYMTILFYLNDVEKGGETAFPVADNETFNMLEIKKHGRNLFEDCDTVNLKVFPSKGKAIIWYNHFIDSKTQWLGELDDFSLHGSCPVKRGEKWIANFWIRVTDDKEEDIKKMRKFA